MFMSLLKNWDSKVRYLSSICCMPYTATPCAGANTGIGYETVKALASKGYATVLACRDLNKGRATRDKIKCALLRAPLRCALQGSRHSLDVHVIAERSNMMQGRVASKLCLAVCCMTTCTIVYS
jgi:hypothetical protein